MTIQLIIATSNRDQNLVRAAITDAIAEHTGRPFEITFVLAEDGAKTTVGLKQPYPRVGPVTLRKWTRYARIAERDIMAKILVWDTIEEITGHRPTMLPVGVHITRW